ncbi:DUF2726 domain-containing protein [Polaromonas sp. P2-4]|nr:DUF2726 domain-containing protein [Polaromonas sp. P2-4]
MMMDSYLVIGFFIFLGSIALGALAYERWLDHVISARKTVARNHALRRKPLTSKDELQMWRWLEEVFPDHHVLVQVPLTNFIEPNNRDGDSHWKALLSTVSFACAVSDRKGTVLGCIDVLGRGGMADRKHAFKRELLGRANIPYWVLENQRRPDANLLREKFLSAVTGPAEKQRLAQQKEARHHARKPRPALVLEQRRLSRVSSNASALTKTGMTPINLKSTLKLHTLAKALASRLAARQSRKPLVYPRTSSSLT